MKMVIPIILFYCDFGTQISSKLPDRLNIDVIVVTHWLFR